MYNNTVVCSLQLSFVQYYKLVMHLDCVDLGPLPSVYKSLNCLYNLEPILVRLYL